MKVFAAPILFLCLLSVEAFAQSTQAVPLIGQVGTPGTLPRFWPRFPSYRTPADSVASAPFSYRSFDHGTQCSDEILEAFQIASSIGLPGFDRPAFNRIQNVVVHIARHYGSEETVRVNRDCVRSLSCSSLYEKSVIQRIPLRPPK